MRPHFYCVVSNWCGGGCGGGGAGGDGRDGGGVWYDMLSYLSNHHHTVNYLSGGQSLIQLLALSSSLTIQHNLILLGLFDYYSVFVPSLVSSIFVLLKTNS